MKQSWTLTKSEICDAIREYISNKVKLEEPIMAQVDFNIQESRDYFDRPSYGYDISATVTEK